MSSTDIGSFRGPSPLAGETSGSHRYDATKVPAYLVGAIERDDSGEQAYGGQIQTTESPTLDQLAARRLDRKNGERRHRIAVISLVGLLAMAGVGSGFAVMANGASKEKKSPPIIHNSFLEGLPAKFPNVLRVKPDAEHPGLEEVTYRFSPGHASLSHAYLTVDPKMKQGFEDAIGNLETYNGGNRIVRYGGVLTFLVDAGSKPGAGIIVANPDQPPGAER